MNSSHARFRSLASVAVGFATLALPTQIHAGPAYYIFDLGTLGDPPGATPPASRALGINNLNQVVGETSTTAYECTPFVWLFSPAYGQPTFTMISLMPAGSFPSTVSAAHDINEAGIIVGSGPRSFGIDQAYAWRMEPAGQISPVGLGNLFSGSPASYPAEALAVNDQDPPTAVGTSVLTSGGNPERGAFQVELTFGGPLPPPLQLLSHTTDICDDGLGINNPGSGGSPPARTVGARGFCTTPIGEDCVENLGQGFNWIGTGIPPFPLLNNLTEATNSRHVARDINDAGNIVGSGKLDFPGDMACIERAAYWNSSTATPLNLGTLAGIDQFDETFTNAINNVQDSKVQVVGENVTLERAFLWECTSGCSSASNWSVTNLTNEIPSAPGWGSLIEATDINDGGWIVGWGDRIATSGIQERAFVLDPIETCWADFVGELGGPPDCKVKGEDLAVLLGAWGNPGCGGSKPCYPDLDQDGDVDGFDLAHLNGVWTGDDFCEECASGFMSGGSGGPLTLQEGIEALIAIGEIDLAAFLADVWPES